MGLICDSCGHDNRPGTAFCESCDEYLDWAAAPPGPAGGTSPPPGGSARTAGGGTASAGTAGTGARVTGAPARGDGDAATTVQGERSCPRCRVPNPRERRFCRRCGQWLVPATVPPPAPCEPGWLRWWRRLIGPWGRAERAAYRRSLSPVTRVFRGVLALAVILLLVLVLSPVAGNPAGKARDLVENRLGTGRVAPATVTVTALPDPASESPALTPDTTSPTGSGPLSALTDDVRATAWSAPWGVADRRKPARDRQDCGEPVPQLGPVGFVVTFRQPTNVRQIGFESGGLGDPKEPDKVRSVLPVAAELVWTSSGDDGTDRTTCRRITLRPTTTLQRVGVDEGPVRQVTVRVVDGWLPPPRLQKDPLVLRIGELTFWQR